MADFDCAKAGGRLTQLETMYQSFTSPDVIHAMDDIWLEEVSREHADLLQQYNQFCQGWPKHQPLKAQQASGWVQPVPGVRERDPGYVTAFEDVATIGLGVVVLAVIYGDNFFMNFADDANAPRVFDIMTTAARNLLPAW